MDVVVNKVSERVFRILQDAYWTLKLIEGEQLNADVRANLRGVRAYANAIVELVDEILSESNKEVDFDGD